MTRDQPDLKNLFAEAMFDTSPYAVIIWDTNFRSVAVNELAAAINGVTVKDHVGLLLEDVTPHVADQVKAICEITRRTGKPVFAQRINDRKLSGAPERFWDANVFPLKDNGEVVGFATVATDVTEQVVAIRTLDQQGHRIYEDIVQTLTAAKLSLELDSDRNAVGHQIGVALESARAISAARMNEELVIQLNETMDVREADAMTRNIPVRILVCDDEPVLRMLYVTLLGREEDFEVVAEAANGQEAVTKAEELHPDLVLLDLNMPIMSGFEALPHLRRVAPSATVVVLSALDPAVAADEAVSRGASAYLEKGIPAPTILKRLREIVGLPARVDQS